MPGSTIIDGSTGGRAAAAGGGEVLSFGAFELDLDNEELRRGGVLLRLAPQPFRLLAFFAARAGELVTREAIRDHLWGPGTHVEFDQGINALVRELRRVLGDDAGAPRFLATVPRRGYRFVAPVERRAGRFATVREEAVAGRPAPAAPPAVADGRSRRRSAAVAGAVAAMALVAAIMATWQPQPATLAVLPFDDVGAGDSGYVATGLSEELITLLGRRFRGQLRVISPTSALAYGRSDGDPRAFARAVGADYVLSGTIRRQGEELRISARLARAETAAVLWATSYERTTDDPLGVQERLAASIAEALSLNLLPPHQRASEATASTSWEAYSAYLHGQYLLRTRPGPGPAPRDAYADFSRAVELDPGFAAAWAGLARAAWRLGGAAGVVEAERHAARALALDDGSAPAHLLLGNIALYAELDFASSRAAFERALAINPSYAEAHHALAGWLSARGRHDEALRSLGRAVTLDPLAPAVRSDTCWFPYVARRWEEALAGAEATLALSPGYSYALECRLLAHLARHDLAAATEAAAAVIAATDARHAELAVDPAAERAVAAAARRFAAARDAGDPRAAVELFWRWRLAVDDLVARHPRGLVSPEERAVAHAALGEKDAALDLLEGALDRWTGWRMPFLAVDPEFDPLRDEPRFQAVVAKALADPVPAGR